MESASLGLSNDVLENFFDFSSLWTASQQYNSLWFHHSDVCVSVVQTMKTENAPFGVCSMPSSHTFGLYVFSAKVSAQDKINDTVTKASPLPNTQCQ